MYLFVPDDTQSMTCITHYVLYFGKYICIYMQIIYIHISLLIII